jgi:hypothetical protein
LKAKRIGGTPERGIKGRTVIENGAVHYSNVSLVDPVTECTHANRTQGAGGWYQSPSGEGQWRHYTQTRGSA